MARIAKKKLPDSQLHNLFSQLEGVLGGASSKEVSHFLGEFFGPEERIMFAKRLAIIVMLAHNNSLYKVANVLNVSTATASKILERLESGHYDNLLVLLKKNKRQYKSLLETLDSLLHLGGFLPHYTGMERYRNVNKLGNIK